MLLDFSFKEINMKQAEDPAGRLRPSQVALFGGF
jgi:hypothetical protein